MAPDSLFCTQIWPPWRHVKTIYSVAIHMKAVRSFVCSPNTWYFFDLKGFVFLILDVKTLRRQRVPFQIVVVIPTWRLAISHLSEEHRSCRVRWSVVYRVYWRTLFAQTSCLDPLSIQLCPGHFEKMRDCCSEDRTTGKKCRELENMNVKNKIQTQIAQFFHCNHNHYNFNQKLRAGALLRFVSKREGQIQRKFDE